MIKIFRLLCWLSLSLSMAACSTVDPLQPSDYAKIAQPEILKKASRGEEQDILVELFVLPNLLQVALQAREEAHQKNQPFLERTLRNSSAYEYYISQCNATATRAFPDGRIGKATVLSFSYLKPTVVVKVSDAKSLNLILKRPEVKSVNVPSFQYWQDQPNLHALYDGDPNCPKGECIKLN